MSRTKLLFIEDDATFRNVLCRELRDQFDVSAYSTAEEGLRAFESVAPDVCLVDMHLPGKSGLEFLRESRLKQASIQMVFLTGNSDISDAVEAMREGAYDFLVKPAPLDKLEQTLLKAAEKTMLIADVQRLTVASAWSHAEGEILGDTAPMLELKRSIEKFGPRAECVLIAGERGTGKELVALNLHRRSLRAQAPFVVANCCAMVPERLALDLFGEHGNSGLWGAARGGSLFIDAIESLPAAAQDALMGALVAAPESPPLPVRILAATEGDLQAEAHAGRFRQDLSQRLSGLRLTLPALRDRRADVPLLARTFLRRIAERENTPLELSPAALDALSTYDWPGNVRELKSAITRLAVLVQHQPITGQDVQDFVLRSGQPAAGALPTLRIEELEQQALVLALELTGSDKKAAAEQLGVSLRTLYNMLERYDLKGRYIRH